MAHRTREIRITALTERPYIPDEWGDALVIVQSGVLELESRGGVRRRFGLGAILFLAGLRLRSVRNPGDATTVLIAVTRVR